MFDRVLNAANVLLSRSEDRNNRNTHMHLPTLIVQTVQTRMDFVKMYLIIYALNVTNDNSCKFALHKNDERKP